MTRGGGGGGGHWRLPIRRWRRSLSARRFRPVIAQLAATCYYLLCARTREITRFSFTSLPSPFARDAFATSDTFILYSNGRYREFGSSGEPPPAIPNTFAVLYSRAPVRFRVYMARLYTSFIVRDVRAHRTAAVSFSRRRVCKLQCVMYVI